MLRKALSLLLLLPTGPALADPLFSVMAGEFALQAGQHDRAAGHYLDAAVATADPALVERAARIGLMAGRAELAEKALAHWEMLDPKSEALLQLRASLALQRIDIAAAVEVLRTLFASGEAGARLAMQALASDVHALPAGLVLRDLLRQGALPDLPEVWVGLGLITRRHQQPGLAVELAERAVERFPQQARMRLWLAEERLLGGDREAARRDMEQALEMGALDPALRMSAAALLERMGESARAAGLLAEGPQDEESIGTRAALLARDDASGAIEALYREAEELDGERTPARLLLLGQLAELAERDADALRWYAEVRVAPQRARAQLRLAVLHDRLGDATRATTLLHELQHDPEADLDAVRDAYLLEAELLLRRNAETEALDAYRRGLEVLEEDARLRYGRALLLERLDRVDEAILDLETLVETEPNNPDNLNALGYTLVDRTDRIEEGLALIERALALRPDSAAIIDSHGWALYRLGRLAESEAELRRAFELQPDPEIAAHLGEVLWKQGRHQEAREVWDQGHELDPENRLLVRTVQRLSK